ncbi:hypothetical protein [Serratia fonticola]
MSDEVDEYFEKLCVEGIPNRRWSKEGEMAEAWLKAAAHNEWKEKVVAAARQWVNCKGRYHSEQNMTVLIELFRQEPEKP